MSSLELTKKFVKQLGISKLLEKWIVHTHLGAITFLAFMNIQASQKNIKIQLQKTDNRKTFIIQNNGKLVVVSLRHFAYVQDIIHNFDYYFNAVQPDKIGNQLTVDYSQPRQHILLPSKVSFFFSSFAEPLETTNIYLQKGNLKEGDIVLDLGSYCGSTVWGFAKAVGTKGMVYGFEPDPINYEMLCKNIEFHGLSNVVAFNKGVWTFSGTMSFQSEGNMGSGISKVQSRSANLLSIPVISLTDFCREFNIERIDYIKMDIEGAEFEVLNTSGELLDKYKPRLIIEPHVVGTRVVTEDICKFLSTRGYGTEILAQADLPLPLIYAFPSLKDK